MKVEVVAGPRCEVTYDVGSLFLKLKRNRLYLYTLAPVVHARIIDIAEFAASSLLSSSNHVLGEYAV